MTKKYYENMKKFFQQLGIDTGSEIALKSAKDCPKFTATLSSDTSEYANSLRIQNAINEKYYGNMKKFFQELGIDTGRESVSESAKDCPNFTATLSNDISEYANKQRIKVK